MIATPDKRYLVQIDILDTQSVEYVEDGPSEPRLVFHGSLGVSSENVEEDVVKIAASIEAMIDHYTSDHLDEDGEFDESTVETAGGENEVPY